MLKNEVYLSYIHNIRNYSIKIYNQLIIKFKHKNITPSERGPTAAFERRARASFQLADAERASSAYLPPSGASVLCMECRMLLIPQTRCVVNTLRFAHIYTVILGPKHIGITTLTCQRHVTHFVPRWPFPIGAPRSPSRYLQPFPKY